MIVTNNEEDILYKYLEKKVILWYKNARNKYDKLTDKDKEMYLNYQELSREHKEDPQDLEIRKKLVNVKILCFESPVLKDFIVYRMKIDKYVKELKYNLKEVLEI